MDDSGGCPIYMGHEYGPLSRIGGHMGLNNEVNHIYESYCRLDPVSREEVMF